jgi:hypothetical protein
MEQSARGYRIPSLHHGKKHREIAPPSRAVSVEVSHARVSPTLQKDAEIGAIHDAVVVEVGVGLGRVVDTVTIVIGIDAVRESIAVRVGALLTLSAVTERELVGRDPTVCEFGRILFSRRNYGEFVARDDR